jgi:hypothetical protein
MLITHSKRQFAQHKFSSSLLVTRRCRLGAIFLGGRRVPSWIHLACRPEAPHHQKREVEDRGRLVGCIWRATSCLPRTCPGNRVFSDRREPEGRLGTSFVPMGPLGWAGRLGDPHSPARRTQYWEALQEQGSWSTLWELLEETCGP